MIRGKPSPAQGPASARRSEPGLNTHKSHHFVTLLALIKRGAGATTTGGRFIPRNRHWQRLHITASIAPARPHHRKEPDNGRKPENHIDDDQDLRSASVKGWMRVKGLRRRRHFLPPRFDQQRRISFSKGKFVETISVFKVYAGFFLFASLISPICEAATSWKTRITKMEPELWSLPWKPSQVHRERRERVLSRKGLEDCSRLQKACVRWWTESVSLRTTSDKT